MRTKRRDILEEHDLAVAPPEVRRFFWRRYNSTNRRKAGLLGDLAAEVASRHAAAGIGQVDRLEEAWRSVLPEELGRRTRLEGLSGGRLQVIVDSAATRYVLVRQLGGQLVEALNEAAGTTLVRKIDCRVGRIQPRA
jgi:hypothetical protein